MVRSKRMARFVDAAADAAGGASSDGGGRRRGRARRGAVERAGQFSTTFGYGRGTVVCVSRLFDEQRRCGILCRSDGEGTVAFPRERRSVAGEGGHRRGVRVGGAERAGEGRRRRDGRGRARAGESHALPPLTVL